MKGFPADLFTQGNALHAKCFISARGWPTGLISTGWSVLLPRRSVLFHGPVPGSIWTFHSILFLAYTAAQLGS